MNTQATQTSPNMAGSHNTVNTQTNQRNGAPQHSANGQKQAPPAGRTKKNRRPTGKEYLIAARQRRQHQEFRNIQNPVAAEDVWICEFCEYERIFGTPPEALIKQYEIKDRRLRKQEAERRRLLEKAKMKGRKGKKGNKAAPKATNTHDRQPQHHAVQPPPTNQSHSQDTQSDDYYDDGFDEDYNQDELPPSPVTTPHKHEPLRPDPGKRPSLQGGAIGDANGHHHNVT